MEFAQKQSDYLWQLQQAKGHPIKISGVESPEFDDYPEKMEQWAHANNLALNADQNGYAHRPVLLPNGKSQIWEVPDAQSDWSKLKDANGKPFSGFVDPLGAMAHEHQIAETRALNAKSDLDEADARKALTEAKKTETASGARDASSTRPRGCGLELFIVTKMKPGQIEQVPARHTWTNGEPPVPHYSRCRSRCKATTTTLMRKRNPEKMASLEQNIRSHRGKRSERYGLRCRRAA